MASKASCTKYLSEKKSETPKPDIKPVEKSKDPINEDYSRFRGHSDDSLDSLLQTSKVPVAIYFWSQSCKSCYTEWFKIYELKIDSKINSVSINVDSFKKTAAKYKVESFPTLIILDGDKVIQRISNVTKAKVEEALASLVAKKKVEAPKVVEKATVNPSSPKPNITRT